jgi:hypothetical protein
MTKDYSQIDRARVTTVATSREKSKIIFWSSMSCGAFMTR